jgi:hypothetical protein
MLAEVDAELGSACWANSGRGPDAHLPPCQSRTGCEVGREALGPPSAAVVTGVSTQVPHIQRAVSSAETLEAGWAAFGVLPGLPSTACAAATAANNISLLAPRTWAEAQHNQASHCVPPSQKRKRSQPAVLRVSGRSCA